MKKRQWLSMALIVALLLSLTIPAFASVEEGTVELFSQKKEDVEIYDAILADFMAANPDVKIVQTTTADGTTFLSRVATNDIPDIGGVFLQSAYFNMMDEGYFLDLTGESFLSAVNADILALSSHNGKNFVLPLTLNGFALYINMDIYNQYGLSVPTTYDALIANCEALKAAGVTPFAFPFKETAPLGQNFERLLGGVVDHEAWKVSEAVAAGATYKENAAFVDFVSKWYALSRYTTTDPLSTDTDDCARMFANQEVAMVFNGTWGNSVYMSLNPELNYEAVMPPAFGETEPFTCGTVDIALTVGADSKNVDAAKRFLTYFVSDEAAQKFAEGDKNPNIVNNVKYDIPHLSAISAALSNGQFSLIPSTYWPAGYRDELQVLLQQLLLDGDTDAFLAGWDTMTVDFYTAE